MDAWFEKLRKELKRPLPGPDAQLLMSPSAIRIPEKSGLPAKGSVMILLYPFLEDVYTLFIKRATYDGVHSGQISFPGGMNEIGDGSPFDTALRETEEEIGIPRNRVEVIGRLTQLHIPVSNVDVTPVVGVTRNKPDCVPEPNEVEFVIHAKLDDLLHPENVLSETIRVGAIDIEAPYYGLQDHHIWGATAMMLSEFLEVVRRIQA